MNKIRIFSSAAAISGVTTILSMFPIAASAVSNTIDTLTSKEYDITFENNELKLKFKNSSNHRNISNIKIFIDESKNDYLEFEKGNSEFTLKLDKPLKGNYTLRFENESFINSDNSPKQMYSNIYIDVTETSTTTVSNVFSLSPTIMLYKSNDVYSIRAKLPSINPSMKITNAKIIDSNNNEISLATNLSNPRNLRFDFSSTSLNNGDIYYIDYTTKITDSNNKEIYENIRVPFIYSTESLTVNSLNTTNFKYTATANTDSNFLDLSINLDNFGASSSQYTVNFFDGDNPSAYYQSTLTNGKFNISKLPKNKLIGVEIEGNGKYQKFYFKSPNAVSASETSLNILNFIEQPNFSIANGEQITVSIDGNDISNSGLLGSTYLEMVYVDSFGEEIPLTDERRIVSSTTQATLTFNSNISLITESLSNTGTIDGVIYAKVKSGTKNIVFPFDISNISSNVNSLQMNVTKSSNETYDTIDLRFSPSSDFLLDNGRFSENDTLVINNTYQATLSSTGKLYGINIPQNNINDGINTYTLTKNFENGQTLEFTGEFIVDKPNVTVDILNPIESITPISSNSDNFILKLDINDTLLNGYLNNRIYLDIVDDFGNQIKQEFEVKSSSNNKFIEIVINPSHQLIYGQNYTVNLNVNNTDYKTSFIFSDNERRNVNLGLVFNDFNKFTIDGLNSIPGSEIYDFNIKIKDNSRRSHILYENYSRTSSGEKIKSDIITRDLDANEVFEENEKYIIEITNVSTGDVYTQSFTFRESRIDPDYTASNLNDSTNFKPTITVANSSIKTENDLTKISYTVPKNLIISKISTSNDFLNASYDETSKNISITNLVPEKLYKNLKITITFTNGKTQTLTIPEFTSNKSNNSLKNYIARVYTVTLTPSGLINKNDLRYADESGFNYWFNQLESRNISGKEFIFSILHANEFTTIHKSSQSKIEALYPIIVNRDGDINGINYWVTQYNNKISKGLSESVALTEIITLMLNEPEATRVFSSLGIRIN